LDSTGAGQANGGNAFAYYDNTAADNNKIEHPFNSFPT
jgi:hypothetical protein